MYKKKKVLISGLNISKQNTGVQYYSEYLFDAISKIKSEVCDISIIKSKKTLFVNPFYRIFFENFFLKRKIQKNKIHLYHATSYVIPFLINTKAVVTVHDLIAIDFPKLCKSTSVIYFKLFLKKSLLKAEKIITVSEIVKSDIIKHYKVNPSKINVIPLGIDPIFRTKIDLNIKEKYNLPDRYILFVGNLEAKKNLKRLFQAFKKVKEKNTFDHKLILVGKKGWKAGDLNKLISQLNLDNQISFLGYVPKKDLPAIYSMADVFVFPSIYEGFGIPPLEAMACETPVIVSSQGASPEVCGDACLKVDPYKIDDIANGMELIITNKTLSKDLILKGLKQVQQYSWEKAAIKTVKVYEEVCV